MKWIFNNFKKVYPDRRPYNSPSGQRRRRPVPDRIQHYYIPLSVMNATNKVMRRFAQEDRECYVWWGGYFTQDGNAQVMTVIYPEIQTDFGRVYLSLSDLTKLHSKLRDADQVLLVELHTHPPGAGGQNEIDAANPATTYSGFVSMVVPDFAFPRFYDLRKIYIYEYLDSNKWRQLETNEIERRFIIEESFLAVEID